ncbi:MAG TPA: apolipoprotein N-acyltransferase [Steroidobacteraceae bacterium]|jgi:apolipoprotein N-acyltransferase|nr:apolipoprotein N-acyltransferase [Steroidobacteraceae bacterium]
MLKLNFYGAFGLATLSGCLWFLAVTPFDLSALAWFAAVPMLLAVDRAPTFKQALLLGWWAGIVETAGGFYWLIDLMQRFADFPVAAAALVFLLFCAARGLIFLLFTAVLCGIRRRRRVPMTVLAPLGLVSCELLVPQIFPCGQWISQAWHPLVIQIAELTGPLGVTALLMLINGALYDLAVDRRAALFPAMAAAALLAAVLIFGALRIREVDELAARAPLLKIGLVQPNFAYTVDNEISRDEAIRQLTALQAQSRRLQQGGAQLIVWSEGSYPVALPRDFSADFPAESPGMIRRGLSVPVVIGADMYDASHDDAFNSAILLDGDGRVAGRYDKVRLLAFGEYIPGIDAFPWLRQVLPANTGRFTAGAGPGVLTLQGPGAQVWKLGPVICYEDILPGFVRGAGQLRPNLLVNLTSDSWFGAETEPWEHLALAVFASVELRVSMVRAVNSGVSAVIDPNGRVLQKTYADDPYRNPRPEDGIVVTAPMMPGAHTAYVAVGNLFAYLCIAATLILAGVAARTKGGAREPKAVPENQRRPKSRL